MSDLDISFERDEFFRGLGEDPMKCHAEVRLGDKAIGGVVKSEDCCELIGLFVSPNHRGQGVGQELLEKLEALCEGTIRLATHWELQPAIRMYQRNGYGIVDYDDTYLVMEKVKDGCK